MKRLLVHAFGTSQYHRFSHKELEAFFKKHNIEFNWLQRGQGIQSDVYIHLVDGFKSSQMEFFYGGFNDLDEEAIDSGEHYIFYKRVSDGQWHMYEADLCWLAQKGEFPKMEGTVDFGDRVTEKFVSKYKKKKKDIPSYKWDHGTTKRKKEKFEVTEVKVGDKVVWEKEIEDMKFLSMMMLATKL